MIKSNKQTPKPKVTIIQADSRSLNFRQLALTSPVNKKACEYLNTGIGTYEYCFVRIGKKYKEACAQLRGRKARYAKIFVIDDILKQTESDFLVFLDSDAWIQNANYLYQLICKLLEDKTKIGCYSRDPYMKYNTYVNSGSFILKVNDKVKEMYEKVKYNCHNISKVGICSWANDQYYISQFVHANKEDYYIFKPTILNSPVGQILRHNWWKDRRMDDETKTLIKEGFNNQALYLNLDANLDNASWPNKRNLGGEYRLTKKQKVPG